MITTEPASTALTLQVSIVIEIVAKHYARGKDSSWKTDLMKSELTGRDRTEPIVTQRQIAMYLARKHTAASLPFLARCFKKKHHCTVSHAVTTIERKRKADKALSAELQTLAQKITAALV